MGSLFFLQRILQTQESNRGLLHCRQILYQLNYQGSPEGRYLISFVACGSPSAQYSPCILAVLLNEDGFRVVEPRSLPCFRFWGLGLTQLVPQLAALVRHAGALLPPQGQARVLQELLSHEDQHARRIGVTHHNAGAPDSIPGWGAEILLAELRGSPLFRPEGRNGP